MTAACAWNIAADGTNTGKRRAGYGHRQIGKPPSPHGGDKLPAERRGLLQLLRGREPVEFAVHPLLAIRFGVA